MAQDRRSLDPFRTIGPCSWCGRPGPREPHHYFHRRGMGGNQTINHPFNIVALCRACHAEAHAGRITRWDFLALVAAREGKLQRTIVNTLRRIFNAPRGQTDENAPDYPETPGEDANQLPRRDPPGGSGEDCRF